MYIHIDLSDSLAALTVKQAVLMLLDFELLLPLFIANFDVRALGTLTRTMDQIWNESHESC